MESVRISANARSSSSPAPWPRRALRRLKPSRSQYASATGRSSARAAATAASRSAMSARRLSSSVSGSRSARIRSCSRWPIVASALAAWWAKRRRAWSFSVAGSSRSSGSSARITPIGAPSGPLSVTSSQWWRQACGPRPLSRPGSTVRSSGTRRRTSSRVSRKQPSRSASSVKSGASCAMVAGRACGACGPSRSLRAAGARRPPSCGSARWTETVAKRSASATPSTTASSTPSTAWARLSSVEIASRRSSPWRCATAAAAIWARSTARAAGRGAGAGGANAGAGGGQPPDGGAAVGVAGDEDERVKLGVGGAQAADRRADVEDAAERAVGVVEGDEDLVLGLPGAVVVDDVEVGHVAAAGLVGPVVLARVDQVGAAVLEAVLEDLLEHRPLVGAAQQRVADLVIAEDRRDDQVVPLAAAQVDHDVAEAERLGDRLRDGLQRLGEVGRVLDVGGRVEQRVQPRERAEAVALGIVVERRLWAERDLG